MQKAVERAMSRKGVDRVKGVKEGVSSMKSLGQRRVRVSNDDISIGKKARQGSRVSISKSLLYVCKPKVVKIVSISRLVDFSTMCTS